MIRQLEWIKRKNKERKNVKRKFLNEGNFQEDKRTYSKQEEQKKDSIIYYEYKKSGHIKVDHPKLKKDLKRDK